MLRDGWSQTWSVVLTIALVSTSMLLAALLGIGAHRASICTVKAVTEIWTTRRGYMLASFGKTVLWVIAITIGLTWLAGEAVAPVTAWHVSLLGLVGGFVFGVGAVINDGCAFSTLTRLANGQIVIVLSLLGFCSGIVGHRIMVGALSLPTVEMAEPLIDIGQPWALGILVVLVVWILWEILAMFRARSHAQSRPDSNSARRYRLSTAAALMGVSNGLLYALVGTWAYTYTLDQQVQQLFGWSVGPGILLWLLFVSLLFGMALSAWQSGQLRPDWRFSNWAAYLAGGFLMGLGAGLARGGNDVLLLHGIPGLSPHALPVFAAMILGIAVALSISERRGRAHAKVARSGEGRKEA